MNKIKEFLGSINSEFKTGLSIALAIILVFSLGNIAGSITNINATPVGEVADAVQTAQSTTAATTAPTTASTTVPTTATPTTAAPSADTTAPTQSAAASQTTTAPQSAPSTGAPTAKGEILALFNESANKIKTNATKATRNYQDIQVVDLELPSVLQSLGDSLIEKFVTPDFTPLEWTGADIAENYPVGGTDYVSKLTEADLANATCTDNGTEYEVVLNINPQTDPTPDSGTGTNAIFWVMNKEDISANVPGLQSCTIDYHDCTVTAKIDKATGNMTYAKYNFYFDIAVSIKVLATLDAGVNVLVDEEYVMTY